MANKTSYLSAAETAKLVRKALKAKFQGVKFSVRTSTYSGGASIDVRWTNGPLVQEVDPIVKVFEGSGFDGMIDLKYGKTHYLKPDGSVYIHRDPGTGGNGGVHVAEDNAGLERLMPDDVEVVHFLADYVFTHREISDLEAKKAEAVQWLKKNVDADSFINGGLYHSLKMMAYRVVENRKAGDSLLDAFNRRFG